MSDQKKRTLKGAAGFLFSNVVTQGLGFLFIVISSRVLGPSEFGILSLGLSVIGIASNFGSFGLPSTIQRYLSGKGETRVGELFGSILFVGILSALFVALALLTFSHFLANTVFNEPRLVILLRVLSVSIFLRILYSILNSILQAQERIKHIIISGTTRSVGKVSFLLLLFIWFQNAIVAALAGIFATTSALFYVIYYVKQLDIKPKLPVKDDIKKVVFYSIPLMVVGFSYLLTQQTDRLMLGWLSSSSDVGIYSVVSTLALIMSTFHGSLVSIFLPIASQAYRNKKFDELSNTYLFISKWIGSVNGFIAIIFAGFGGWFLTIFGAEYTGETSYQILLLLSFLYFFGTLVGPTGALLQMSDGHKIEFYNTLIFFVLNILLNYFFILKYGLAGAAIGTLISGIVRNILQLIEIKYFYKINVLKSDNMLLLVIVSLAFLLCYVFNSYRLFISMVSMFMVFAFLLVGIEDYETQLLRRAFNKISI